MILLAFSYPVKSEIRVQDDQNREVILISPAQRIITLAPHATEMLLSLEVRKKIIAAAQFFDYPSSMQDVPKISTLGGLDRERLIAYKPDLVIAWASGNRLGDLQWLAKSGIPVFMSEPENLAAIAATLEKLGVLTGDPRKGELAANKFKERIAIACRQRQNSSIETAYYEIWPKPPMTIGGKHWLNEVLELARLRNVFAAVPRGIFKVSAESLVANPAEVLITSQPELERSSSNSRMVAASPTLGRPGPRIVEGLEQLCRNL